MDKLVVKTVQDIKALKIQGARNIAIAALDALINVAKKSGFEKEFFAAADALQNSRKTAVPLYNIIEATKNKKNIEAMFEMKHFFEIAMMHTAQNGANLIKNNTIIMTHCHSSEAILAMKLAKRQGKKFKVIVTETRPKMQGIKTAQELRAAKIPVDYIVDSAAGLYMKDAGIFLVGCDSIRPEGIYNKIGTYLMAVCAQKQKVPVYFIGDSLKIDRRKYIEIEMRDVEEITRAKDLKGANISNPAFDCTPWNLISGVVTEKDVFNAKEALKSFEFAK